MKNNNTMDNKNSQQERKPVRSLSAYGARFTLKNCTVAYVHSPFGESIGIFHDDAVTFVNTNTTAGRDLDDIMDKLSTVVSDISFKAFTGQYKGKDYSGFHVTTVKKIKDRELTDEEKEALKEKAQTKLEGF